MSDGLSDGARETRIREAYRNYYAQVAECLEGQQPVRRRKSAVEAARALDEATNSPKQGSGASRLVTLLSELNSGDRVIWAKFLLHAFNLSTQDVFDRLVAVSPYRGKSVMFVDHWASGSADVEGDFRQKLADLLRKHRKFPQHREQFLVAVDMPAITDDDIVRIPRSDG